MAENGELLPVYEVTEDGQRQRLAVLKIAEGHVDFIDRANPTAEPIKAAVSPELWACKIINRSISNEGKSPFNHLNQNQTMKELVKYHDLLPEVEADPAEHIVTLVQRNDREALLFVINTSPEVCAGRLRFSQPRQGRLQPLLAPGPNIVIKDGQAEIILQAGIVEVFRVLAESGS